jgi:hypothetical protein
LEKVVLGFSLDDPYPDYSGGTGNSSKLLNSDSEIIPAELEFQAVTPPWL